MYFTETVGLLELEQLMRIVPNFSPRGGGVPILQKHKYTAADCDCALCLYHIGRNSNARCRLEHCICFRERLAAGAVSQKEILLETLSAIRYPPFAKRLRQYIQESEGNGITYRNKTHQNIFKEAIQNKNQKDKALMAAFYLLTADYTLWSSVKPKLHRNKPNFTAWKLGVLHPNGYALFCAAKDLYYGTKHISLADLADAEVISQEVFRLICNAAAIRKFGVQVLENGSGDI